MSRAVLRVLLLLCLCSGCALRVSSDETEIVTRIQSVSAILKEADVESCAWLVGHAPMYLDITIVLAGRVPLETCLNAKPK